MAENSRGTMDTKKKLLEMSRAQIEQFQEYLTRGEANASVIFKILKSKSSYGLSRAKIVGTVGKKSSNGFSHQADFDLVIFVNKEWSPFWKVLENFEQVLRNHYGQYDIYIKKRTFHSLEIRVCDTTTRNAFISFDLLPATNLVEPEYEDLSEILKAAVQTEIALRYIKEHPDATKDLRGYYSNILAERNILFVQGQSEFVQDVIRLAKLWNRQVTWDGKQKLYGRSVMIEYVAIAAACKEENDADSDSRGKSILHAFLHFLKKFLNFDQTMFEFFSMQATLNDDAGKNRSYPERASLKEVPQKSTKYTVSDNPYNNFDDELTRELKCAFESHAKLTLTAVSNYKKYGHAPNFNFGSYFGI